MSYMEKYNKQAHAIAVASIKRQKPKKKKKQKKCKRIESNYMKLNFYDKTFLSYFLLLYWF